MGEGIRSYIEDIFKEHWKYYSEKTATDIAQIVGLTKHISDEYQGRVIYELMQNAFDPAKEVVKVEIKNINDKSYLVVSNDGNIFGYDSTFNHSTQSNPNKNDNFHALCSIATSNKTVEKNIGNKGVGFKSVFSLSNEVYIVSQQSNDKIITFKLYGKIEKIEFDKIKNQLEDIDLYEQEKLFNHKDMVIPGFYYPLLKKEKYLEEALDKDAKTAIVIPLKDKEYIVVKNLIAEIQKYHFEFIKERFKDDEEEKKDLEVWINNNKFVQEKIKIYSEKEFAILWAKREDNKNGIDEYSVLYNFMPSLFKAPFKCMDIHGKFQTSINREHIDFNPKNDIGKKNLEILKEAIIFHFNKLEEVDISENNKDIFWKLLQINNESLKPIIKQILLEKYGNWNNFGKFIAKLAKKYFKEDDLTIENFDNFWKVVFDYSIIAKPYQKGIWAVDTYTHLNDNYIKKLSDVNCIPIIKENEIVEKKNFNNKILYTEEQKTLPRFLNIFITNYNFNNNINVFFKKDFDIELKKFSNNYELLKHFRQIPKDGSYFKSKLDENIEEAENKQKEILTSLYKTMNENEYLSTHRYTKFIVDSKTRENANSENNAYFSISTIFLKTMDKDKPYKPAQLCRKKDLYLEDDFYKELKDKDKNNFDNFLKFLGVSLNDKYIYCEGKIYDNYKDGLDYIPAVVDEDIGKLEASEIIPNIAIVNGHEKPYHPALINENYKFLDTLINTKIKAELENLKVKKYDQFPKEYFNILIEEIRDVKSQNLIRLYNRIFISYYTNNTKDMKYLIIQNNDFSFQKEEDFSIVNTKEEFELLRSENLKLLCYYGGEKKLADNLKSKVLELTYTLEIQNNKKEDIDKLKENLSTLMPYILYNISQLDDFESKIDFLDNSEEKITKLRNDFNNISFNLSDAITKNIKLKDGNSIHKLDNITVAYDTEQKSIYYTDSNDYEELSKVISKVFFKLNKAITQIIENIYLKQSYLKPNDEINNISNIWDNEEYEKNYNNFLSSLFEKKEGMKHLAESDNRWFEYSKNHQSELLKKIKDLKSFSTKVKKMSNTSNLNIELIINVPHNLKIINKLLSIENLEQEDKDCIYNFSFILEEIQENEYQDILAKYKISYIDNLENNSKAQKELEKEKEKENKFKDIKDTLASFTDFSISNCDINTSNSKSTTTDDIHKPIVIRAMDNGTKEIDLKDIGDNGEYVVLGYYINEFMKSDFNKKEILTKIYEKLKKEVPKKEHNKLGIYYVKCVKNILNDEALQESLINLFFVAWHYPLASFDIIAVDDDGEPLLVEVKTTKSTRNNDSFRISSGEMKKAKSSDNYIIVRVTPEKIIFLGNPIKEIKDKLIEISGDNFSIIPNGYTFKFTNKEIKK